MPGGAGHQLASSEPVASSLDASFGAATPAQQGHGGSGARAVRFYLGTVAHPTLLPSAIPIGLKRWFEGNRFNKEETPTKRQRHTKTKHRSSSEATDHGSHSTMS